MIPVIYMDLIDDAQSLVEFEEIYHTYRKRMFYVANTVLQDAHEAEDAVQVEEQGADFLLKLSK